MLSRKMCVVLFVVLTIIWGLSSGNVQRRAKNENKGASASVPIRCVKSARYICLFL